MSGIEIEAIGKVLSVAMNIAPVNALSMARYHEIAEIFQGIGNRSDIQCVVLSSRCERAFCAGKDLKEFRNAAVDDDAKNAEVIRTAFAAVRKCVVPVIAAVGGAAIGAGMVLASVCDFRVASERSSFQMTEIDVGRCGGGAHLGRHIAPGWLRWMYFTAEPINAWQAQSMGFVQHIVPHRQLLRNAMQMAETIAAKKAVTLRMAKEALNQVEDLQVEEGYQLEQAYSTALMKLLRGGA